MEILQQIYITFILLLDEEVGGELGMKTFLSSKEWKDLNVGFALDEGLANPTEEFTVFFGERMPWCNTYIVYLHIYYLVKYLFKTYFLRGQSKLSWKPWSRVEIH